jgi:TolB-like protein/tetratricopeptide (TPR) repeat protein/tRNA A-37 threonylcarbamoyl transferase component Bud32
VPPRVSSTGLVEVAKVRGALGERYRVDRVLGEGGMATVYLAEDLKHKRKVAVKVMRAELAETLGADRFLREVEIAAQLSHPHILPMYDSGATDGLLYYVMPYVEGESLQARIRREGQLPVEDAVRLAREVAEALAHAHERGIIHRDIKPANILLNAGHALVADFGIARAVKAGGEALTKTGLAVGTPQYMSPEQATGSADVDGRADVYAIGSVLYEMLAGEPPFTGPTAQAIMARSLTESPRPLSATREIMPQVEAVVKRAMARSPADRYPTAAALATALGGALDASRSGATPVAAPGGPTGAQVWGLFGFTSVLTLAVVYGLIQRWGLPIWTLGLAVALLAIGAVVLVQTGRIEAKRQRGDFVAGLGRLFTWRNAAAGGGLALGLWAVVATMLVLQGPGASGSASATGIRLAVMPFENRGSSDDAYFADGIADEIRGKLTGLPGFQVTARTSSDQYKATSKSLQDIGKELGVQYLLTATVRWAKTQDGKGRVQVVPELIDTRTGAATWQQTFDADVTDVFQVQSNIAIRVAGALGVALGSTEEKQLTQRPTDNLAAYDLYLKGQALTANDPATLKQASGYYEQAAALDSTFALAWARLSGSLSTLYNNGTPDPTIATRALEAAERAIALDREGAPGHAAMAMYFLSVKKDVSQAEEQMMLALRASPNDPEMLRRTSGIEMALGRWDDALTHVEQARRVDPRSVNTLNSLAGLLVYLRRYPEALAAGSELLALAPSDPNNIQIQAMIYLAQGDLAGARAVIKAAPGSLAEPALVAYLATYNDLYWVLDDAQQRILLRLPPSAFFDDPAAWGSVFMQTYWQRGDKARARAYADTAHAAFVEQLRGAPDDPQLHVLDGLALAYAGKKAEAVAAGERGVALLPISKDARNGAYFQHQLVRIYIMVSEYEKALDKLEPLLRTPYFLSPGWLKIDPAFEPLRGNPRFEKLIAGS